MYTPPICIYLYVYLHILKIVNVHGSRAEQNVNEMICLRFDANFAGIDRSENRIGELTESLYNLI